MRNSIPSFFVFTPSCLLVQNLSGLVEYKIFWFAVLIVLFVGVKILWSFIRERRGYKFRRLKTLFVWKKLKVELAKDRLIRPKMLTLFIKNTGKRYVDIEAPVLIFRKLWSIRKFSLKRVNNQEVYPLYLEAGKTYTVTIDLNRFFEHDKKLKHFYWGRVLIEDVEGRRFRSKRVVLRKSLFS